MDGIDKVLFRLRMAGRRLDRHRYLGRDVSALELTLWFIAIVGIATVIYAMFIVDWSQ